MAAVAAESAILRLLSTMAQYNHNNCVVHSLLVLVVATTIFLLSDIKTVNVLFALYIES